MKTLAHFILLLLCVAQQTRSQEPVSEARRRMLMSSDELLADAVSSVEQKSLNELKSIVVDGGASAVLRSASARLLLQRSSAKEDKLAALPALGIYLPGGLSDTESDWTKNYPVAAEASLHSDLMPQIIQRSLDGALPESVVGFVLLRYQADNHAPGEQLSTLLNSNLRPEQRQRVERLVAILKGESAKGTPSSGTQQEPPSTAPARVVETPAMKKPNESKATTPTASPKIGEPASSTPWSIIVALIVAAGGLLWLAFKRRS